MHIPVIGFIPPITGVEGRFNTLRLGLTLSKRLEVGMVVFLMDEKARVVIGRARVLALATGALRALCDTDGAFNHSELGCADPENAPARLFALMRKIYGPHIATETKKATVVYLERIE